MDFTNPSSISDLDGEKDKQKKNDADYKISGPFRQTGIWPASDQERKSLQYRVTKF